MQPSRKPANSVNGTQVERQPDVLDAHPQALPASEAGAEADKGPSGTEPARFIERRKSMVEQQLIRRDIDDPLVLEAMESVPRHEFVPSELRERAYADHPLPIGHDQTISQPYIVALMTQASGVTRASKALDIGTGSGYQAAVLAEIAEQVYSIEIVEPLGREARDRLQRLGYTNIETRIGDGYQGWSEHAPFDVILVAAAPDHIPSPLLEQLAVGGRLVIPVGRYSQELMVCEKQADGSIQKRRVTAVRFVPMTGQAEGR